MTFLVDCTELICGQSYETKVMYDSRVVIYERKMFIRLATDNHYQRLTMDNAMIHSP